MLSKVKGDLGTRITHPYHQDTTTEERSRIPVVDRMHDLSIEGLLPAPVWPVWPVVHPGGNDDVPGPHRTTVAVEIPTAIR